MTQRFFQRSRLAALAALLLAAGCQDAGPDTFDAKGMLFDGVNATQIADANRCTDPAEQDKLINELIVAINDERAKHGLPPLKINATLMQIADFYACRLVDGGFFSHVDPYDGSTIDTRAADFGYAFRKIGENLAAEQRTVERVMADWMKSPSHRANILDPAYTEIGVAVKGGGDLSPYWVQEFGRSIADPPIPQKAKASRSETPTPAPTQPTSRPATAMAY